MDERAPEADKPPSQLIDERITELGDWRGEMLALLGLDSLDALVNDTVPAAIRQAGPLELGPPRGEHEMLGELRAIATGAPGTAGPDAGHAR